MGKQLWAVSYDKGKSCLVRAAVTCKFLNIMVGGGGDGKTITVREHNQWQVGNFLQSGRGGNLRNLGWEVIPK